MTQCVDGARAAPHTAIAVTTRTYISGYRWAGPPARGDDRGEEGCPALAEDHPARAGTTVGDVRFRHFRVGPPPIARGRPRRRERSPARLGPPPLARVSSAQRSGTTPARAGTTKTPEGSGSVSRDHPGSRGDDREERGPGRGEGRTTPARAGTTGRVRLAAARRRDHPRSRGDDAAQHLVHPFAERTTPARAGTTRRRCSGSPCVQDHPRSRGDDVVTHPGLMNLGGPPPLARGRPHQPRMRPRPRGTTPARAGTTSRKGTSTSADWDHPRSRGDD